MNHGQEGQRPDHDLHPLERQGIYPDNADGSYTTVGEEIRSKLVTDVRPIHPHLDTLPIGSYNIQPRETVTDVA